MTLEPMSAQRLATISPEAVANDWKRGRAVTVARSTGTPWSRRARSETKAIAPAASSPMPMIQRHRFTNDDSSTRGC
ncbi:MAG: hypothetical protein BWX64_01865 [Acidobacteria bacterium ADurb.Bin051]|nr:MAG: hypothetical protein BWX64_01865 [Acidobacteria bacterium ADurb.Bin051]